MSAPATRFARERWLAQQMSNKRRHRRIFKRRVVSIASSVERPHVFEVPDTELFEAAARLARFNALPWWRRMLQTLMSYILTGRGPQWT